MEDSRYPYLRLEHFVFDTEDQAQDECDRVAPHIDAITNGKSNCIIIPFYGKWKLICVNKKNHEQKTREIKLVPESDKVFLGKIKFFNEQKGYGFIVPEDEQQDVFFHQTSVVGASHLDAGEPIEFKVSKTVKGVVAIDIKSAAYN